jgi:hypothetical protein
MAAFGLGRPLLRQLNLDGGDAFSISVYSVALGLTTAGAVLMVLHLLGWLFESLIVALTIIGGCWGMLEISLLWLQTADRRWMAVREIPIVPLADQSRENQSKPPRSLVAAMALAVGVIAIFSLMGALAPPISDAPLSVHLESSKMLLRDSRIVHVPADAYAVSPTLVNLWCAWAMALDSEVCSQLLQWALGGLLALAAVVLAKPIVGTRWAWVAGALASTSPGILLSRFATTDGVAMAAMGTLAIAAWWQRTLHGRSRQWLIVAGLMSGTAIAVNGSACLLLIPLGAWWAWMFWQRPEQRPTLWQAAALVTGLAIIVGGCYRLPCAFAAVSPLPSPLHATASYSARVEHEIFDYLGVAILAAAPGLFLTRRLRGLGAAVGVAGTCCLIGHFATIESLLLAAVPPASVAVVWVWMEMRRFPRLLRRAAVATFACMLLATATPLIVRSGDAFRVAVGLEDREHYLIRREPTFRVAALVNHLLPRNARILSQDMNGLYIERCITPEEAFRRQMGETSGVSDPEVLAERLRNSGFTHLLLSDNVTDQTPKDDSPLGRIGHDVVDPCVVHCADGAVRRYRLVTLK